MKDKRIFRTILYVVILSLILNACASKAATPAFELRQGAPGVAPVEESKSEVALDTASSSAKPVKYVERIVIKNAWVSIVVANPALSMDTISKMTDEFGGFVVSANLSQTRLESGAEVPQASITIRVPAERLNEALERIKKETDRPVRNEKLESQDVTSDYVDLQSRLRNEESRYAQLNKIMESADKTEDVLRVYNEITAVQEQIEVLKGRIKYYEESAALSAISVDLVANEAVKPLTIGGWQPAGDAKKAVQALINTLKFLTKAAIWIVLLILPIIVVLYGVFFLPLRLAWRLVRRRILPAKPKTPLSPPATPPEPN